MKKSIWMALIALLFISCGKGNERLLTSATGSIYECLMVSDAGVKNAVCETMGADMYGLPQMESYFTVSHVTPALFDDLFKATRNILLVDINPNKYTFVKAIKARDVWSKPQAVIRIQAPNEEAFLSYWATNGEALREWFVQEELARQIRFYRASTNKDARVILNKQGYDLLIPASSVFGHNSLRTDLYLSYISTSDSLTEESLRGACASLANFFAQSSYVMSAGTLYVLPSASLAARSPTTSKSSSNHGAVTDLHHGWNGGAVTPGS